LANKLNFVPKSGMYSILHRPKKTNYTNLAAAIFRYF